MQLNKLSGEMSALRHEHNLIVHQMNHPTEEVRHTRAFYLYDSANFVAQEALMEFTPSVSAAPSENGDEQMRMRSGSDSSMQNTEASVVEVKPNGLLIEL